MAQPWGLIIMLLMRKCQRPGYVGMTLSSLGIRVAFTFLFAPILGVPALWWGVCAGWIISAVPTLLHYTSGKWYDVHESNEQCERR